MKHALKLMVTLLLIVSLYYLLLASPNFYAEPALCIAFIAALALLYVTVVSLLRRARFTRRLKRLCRNRGVDLELRGFWRMTFVVRTEAGTFAGMVVPSVFRWIPLLLDEDGKSYRHVYGIRIPSRVRTRRGAVNMAGESRVTITKAYAFYVAPRRRLLIPEGYIRKFVIVNPMPLRVMVGRVQQFVYADNGERIKDYLVYSGGAFCDYLDRQTLSYEDRRERMKL